MSRCLQLAALGAGNVSPNPMVGAVLVHEDRIIGEGYHEHYGFAHAEVSCINAVSAVNRHLIPSSTLYVSLEPCNHFGKTPPCSNLIISEGIKKVVIATADPFEKVAGSGIKKLQDAGVEVIVGVMEKEAQMLNRSFFHFHLHKRPFIILKWAQSANGMIAAADYSRIYISGNATNKLVHRWRSEVDAILVGTNTALHDNPSLTTRLWPGKNPFRLVLDMQLKLDKNSHLLDGTTPTIVYNALQEKKEGLTTFVKIDTNKSLIQQIAQSLYERDITSLMVEGGSKMLQTFIDEDLWDEMRIISNPQMHIEQGIAAPQFNTPKNQFTQKVGNDLISFINRENN